MLPAEQTPDLQQDTVAERTRAVKASRQRASATQRTRATLTAPPSPLPKELDGAAVHVDAGITLPTDWLLHVSRNQAHVVQEAEAHRARFFVTKNPWAPTNVMDSWQHA